MTKISLIGCGRWGTFLGWYAANYGRADEVHMYDIPTSPNFIELKNTRKNSYLSLSDNMILFDNIAKVLENDFIIISIGCQYFRGLCKELSAYDLKGKTFLLAMKGLEEPSGERMLDIMREEICQNIYIATLGGPGHVQDYMAGIPSAAVVDSDDDETKQYVINIMQSPLIRLYYGNDLIGNQVGAALKNVMGLAAGILDGLGWSGLKGALIARAPVEVGRLIKFFGGNPMTAYGLAHLGDYEATLFSKHSHNRMFGEKFARGETFEKLAEGVPTLKAVKIIADNNNIDMPISQALYQAIYEKADIKEVIKKLFERSLKQEFKDITVSNLKTNKKIAEIDVEVKTGDIVKEEVDCIVVPEFINKASYGGVGAAICRADMYNGIKEFDNLAKSKELKYGDAVLTQSGKNNTYLSNVVTIGVDASHQFMTVFSAIMHTLTQAEKLGLKSVVIPELGTGKDGTLTSSQSAKAILGAIYQFSRMRQTKSVNKVIIVNYHGSIEKAQKVLEEESYIHLDNEIGQKNFNIEEWFKQNGFM